MGSAEMAKDDETAVSWRNHASRELHDIEKNLGKRKALMDRIEALLEMRDGK